MDFLGDRHAFWVICYVFQVYCAFQGFAWFSNYFLLLLHHKLKSVRKPCSLNSYPEAPADLHKISNPGFSLATLTVTHCYSNLSTWYNIYWLYTIKSECLWLAFMVISWVCHHIPGTWGLRVHLEPSSMPFKG